MRDGTSTITVKYDAGDTVSKFGGVGGYLAGIDKDTEVRVLVHAPEQMLVAQQTFLVEGQRYWTRIGLRWEHQATIPPSWTVTLQWAVPAQILVWGLNCGVLPLSQTLQQIINEKGLTKTLKLGLLPEGLYLTHDAPLCGGVIESADNVATGGFDRPTPGKKCCQCQRYLPIDPRLADLRAVTPTKQRAPQSMVIAFHGHRSKKTGYQNECRACKKFEINDHFNPIRTSDQHHESSTLMRERKLLLHDGDILEQFKERGSKEGFRTHVWKTFGKKCFKCGKSVTVKEYHLDHTRPLAYLWPLDEHATCLCSDCNNNKKDSFPVEFYSLDERKRLSQIVGLSVEVLQHRAVNKEELQRIRGDIVAFASSWDPRLFESVASRVADLHPEIDIYEELKAVNPELHDKIREALKARPEALQDASEDTDEEDDEVNLFEELGIDPVD